MPWERCIEVERFYRKIGLLKATSWGRDRRYTIKRALGWKEQPYIKRRKAESMKEINKGRNKGRKVVTAFPLCKKFIVWMLPKEAQKTWNEQKPFLIKIENHLVFTIQWNTMPHLGPHSKNEQPWAFDEHTYLSTQRREAYLTTDEDPRIKQKGHKKYSIILIAAANSTLKQLPDTEGLGSYWSSNYMELLSTLVSFFFHRFTITGPSLCVDFLACNDFLCTPISGFMLRLVVCSLKMTPVMTPVLTIIPPHSKTMPTYQSFSTYIVVDGKRLSEHNAKISVAAGVTTVLCWIPSETGKVCGGYIVHVSYWNQLLWQRYKVHWKDTIFATSTSGRVYVDGNFCAGSVMQAKNRAVIKMGIRQSPTSVRPFVFSWLNVTGNVLNIIHY